MKFLKGLGRFILLAILVEGVTNVLKSKSVIMALLTITGELDGPGAAIIAPLIASIIKLVIIIWGFRWAITGKYYK